MAVSFGSPLVLAWLVFMYYRFVDGWLTSLSALGQGLAAMTVVLSVALIGAAVVGWFCCRHPHVDSAVTSSVVPYDVDAVKRAAQQEQKQDDDQQLAIDIDDGSLVWSSSPSPSPLSLSLSLSPSLAKGSPVASWQLSESQSNERYGERIDADDLPYHGQAIAVGGPGPDNLSGDVVSSASYQSEGRLDESMDHSSDEQDGHGGRFDDVEDSVDDGVDRGVDHGVDNDADVAEDDVPFDDALSADDDPWTPSVGS
jgi:hypothetical protein